ncbi:hypothetical protein [Kitasatospora cineracea]|uniref:Uncharacterized protein n=1 Tax=Kitasatospora cineracea TaxID=88074 RepID=A0A3N4R6K4_9ACTN|nr:hypothetical protein [Kitasatospora cineracea]RPE26605.1 hypothetical protein EDD38_7666 [Kitasatospora cineracea]
MNSYISDPGDLDAELEVQLGRRAPYSQLGDWVRLSGVEDGAASLYWDMGMHINTGRAAEGDTEVWPGLRTLSRLAGLKKPEAVVPRMLQLEVIGAVEVIRSTTGLVRRNRYVLHQTPPPGYAGVRSIGDWYALNRFDPAESQEQREQREEEFDQWLGACRTGLKEAVRKAAEIRAEARKARIPLPPVEVYRHPRIEDYRRTPAQRGTARAAGTPKGRTFPPKVENDFQEGVAVPPQKGVRTPSERGQVPPQTGVERDEAQQHEMNKAAGVDDRRSSTGGLARETKINSAAPKADQPGGSAASNRKSPRPKTIKTNPGKPVPGEDEVFAVIDALKISSTPALRVPPLRRAVRELLSSGRTPQHAMARINAGWWKAGAPERLATGEIRRAVPYLAEIISSRECARIDCERGVLLGTGEDCTACGFRAAERQAERARAKIAADAEALAQAAQAETERLAVVAEAEHQRDQEYNRWAPPAPTGPITWRCTAPGPAASLGDGEVCGRPGLGTPPEHLMCPDCYESVRTALAVAG